MAMKQVAYTSEISSLGVGYDMGNTRVKASPFHEELEYETTVFHDGGGGPSQSSVVYKLKFLESASDAEDLLDVSASIGLQKGNISGSVFGSYKKGNFDSSNKVYLLVSVEVTHSITRLLEEPAVRPELVPGLLVGGVPVSNMTSELFYSLYGDSFVSSIELGGRLDGVIEITSSSKSDLQDIKARGSVEVRGLAKGELALDYLVSELTKNRQSTVTFNAIGGGLGIAPMDAKSFVLLSKIFPLMVNGGEAKIVIGASVDGTGEIVGYRPPIVDDMGEEIEPEAPLRVQMRSVSYPGAAVPIRATVKQYKGLPIFSSAPPLLSRLSGAVVDDLVEYYSSFDRAKNNITDIITRASENNLLLEDLVELERSRSKLRMHQVEILKVLTGLEGNNMTSAEATSDLLDRLPAPSQYLFRADTIVAGSDERQRRKEQEALRLKLEQQAAEQLEEAKRLRDEELATIAATERLRLSGQISEKKELVAEKQRQVVEHRKVIGRKPALERSRNYYKTFLDRIDNDKITMWDQRGFKGKTFSIRAGASVGYLSTFNDKMRSLRVGPYCACSLYRDARFQGEELTFGPNAKWEGEGFVSSAKVQLTSKALAMKKSRAATMVKYDKQLKDIERRELQVRDLEKQINALNGEITAFENSVLSSARASSSES